MAFNFTLKQKSKFQAPWRAPAAKILAKKMPPNVMAVYDVLPARSGGFAWE
jgi:hypothetical protein